MCFNSMFEFWSNLFNVCISKMLLQFCIIRIFRKNLHFLYKCVTLNRTIFYIYYIRLLHPILNWKVINRKINNYFVKLVTFSVTEIHFLLDCIYQFYFIQLASFLISSSALYFYFFVYLAPVIIIISICSHTRSNVWILNKQLTNPNNIHTELSYVRMGASLLRVTYTYMLTSYISRCRCVLGTFPRSHVAHTNVMNIFLAVWLCVCDAVLAQHEWFGRNRVFSSRTETACKFTHQP